jgi:hypothetical protein
MSVLNALFSEIANKVFRLRTDLIVKAMDGVDRVGALAKSIKRFKQSGKNDPAGQVHAIQVSAPSKGEPEPFANIKPCLQVLCGCIDRVDLDHPRANR